MGIDARVLILTIAAGKPQRPLCTHRDMYINMDRKHGACTACAKEGMLLRTKYIFKEKKLCIQWKALKDILVIEKAICSFT